MPDTPPPGAEENPPSRRRRRISADEKMLLDRIREREAAERAAAGESPGDEALKKPERVVPAATAPHHLTGGPGAAYHLPAPPPQPPVPLPPASRGALGDFFAHPLVRGALRLLKLAVRFSCLLFLAGLGLAAWAMNEYGQANVTTATLMYLPPLLWLVPVFFLMPAALLFDWKSLVLLVLGTGWYLAGHLNWQFRTSGGTPAPEAFAQMRLLTWNRGQSGSTSLGPIKEAVKPDFILLQDAAGRGGRYRNVPEYQEFREFVDVGEFVLMSRWPVLAAQNLTLRQASGAVTPVGACRFVVMHAGRRVVIYSVHLPSPRDALEATGRGAFLLGVLGLSGTPWEAKKLHYQAFWDTQMLKAAEIARRIREEKEPVVVAGDFNTPAFGPIYRLFGDVLQDAHLMAGSALGQTFPGDTRNPLAFFHPWLRLDQVFASEEWEVLHSQPQPVRSQHLPVFTVLRHRGGPLRPSDLLSEEVPPPGTPPAPAPPPPP